MSVKIRRMSVFRLWTAFVLVAIAAACERAAPESAPATVTGDVEIAVDLQSGQRWTASGPLVDAGAVCPEGTRIEAGYFDAETGEPLTLHELMALAEQEQGRKWEPFDLIGHHEYSCVDGSGSFLVEEVLEDRDPIGVLTVLSGTGAYRAIRGSGTETFAAEPTAEADADALSIHLEITIEAVLDAPLDAR